MHHCEDTQQQWILIQLKELISLIMVMRFCLKAEEQEQIYHNKMASILSTPVMFKTF